MALEKWECPEQMAEMVAMDNSTDHAYMTEIWQSRMREVQYRSYFIINSNICLLLNLVYLITFSTVVDVVIVG